MGRSLPSQTVQMSPRKNESGMNALKAIGGLSALVMLLLAGSQVRRGNVYAQAEPKDAPAWLPDARVFDFAGAWEDSCRIHGLPTALDTVRVAYGLLAEPGTIQSVRQKLFPNSWHFVPGGCVVFENSPDSVIVRYCSMCRDAESRWRKSQEKSGK
jgi:hypothetical protein